MTDNRKVALRARPQPSIVYIVDDDLSIRESLVDLFSSLKMDAVGFESASELLAGMDPSRPGCILLDIRLPGISGLDFQAQLEKMGSQVPIIMMTGFGDIPMSVRAMKAGAVDFLTKPFRDQDILDAVAAAMEKDGAIRKKSAANDAVNSLIGTLTPREVQVMHAVVKGMLNKQIAFDLGISEITVKLHRGNVMRKMQVHTVADLVRMIETISAK